MDGRKKYKNGELTVIWKPEMCAHSGNCVKGLPEVFVPGSRPWVRIETAASDDIRKTIDTCPSGALSYKDED